MEGPQLFGRQHILGGGVNGLPIGEAEKSRPDNTEYPTPNLLISRAFRPYVGKAGSWTCLD